MSSKEKVVLPKPYKYDKKVIQKFEDLNKNGEKMLKSFLGFPEIETIFYLYLFKKYKSDCFLYNEDAEFRVFGLNLNIISRVSKAKEKLFKEHINVIASVFVECLMRGVETIIVPLTIYDNKDITHANILIYRKKFNQIEHFEPHGSLYMGDERRANKVKKPILSFINKINKILVENKKDELKFIPSDQVCPNLDGLQGLECESTLISNEAESTGYCIPWNMFFTELCLANPSIESSRLFEIVFDYFKDKTNIEDYLRKVIRGYTFIIDEKVNKYLTIVMGEEITTEKINNLYENYHENHDEIYNIRVALLELIKLETYMITSKNFNLDEEIKKVKSELRKKGKKDDFELLSKKYALENYGVFKEVTPITPRDTSEGNASVKDILSSILKNKKCPEGKVLNPITKRCNKIKQNKTKKRKSSVSFESIK
jgi:hypothetical protein